MAQRVTEDLVYQGHDKTGPATNSAIGNAQKLDKQLMRTGSAMRDMTRQNRAYMAQFGHQIQDVAVQLQMGMNPMMVLGQQGSQLASIFGAKGALLGAILAVAAAVGGSLAPSLFRAGRQAGQFYDEITQAAGGVDKLTEAQRRLAQLDLQLRIGEQQAAVQAAQLAIDEYNKKIERLNATQEKGGRMGRAAKLTTDRLSGSTTELEQALELANAQLAVTQAQMDALTGKTARAEAAVKALEKAFESEVEMEKKRIDMLLDARSPQEKFLDGLEEIRSILGDPQTPLEVEAYRIQVEKLAEKYFAAGKGADDLSDKSGKLNESMDAVNKSVKKLGEDALKGIEDQFVNLINGTQSVSDSFRNMARSVVDSLIRMQIQANITQPIARMFPSIFGAAAGASSPIPVSDLSNGVMTPAPRAMGGPVSAGRPYLVGERGPELMIPRGAGTIVPNNEMGSSGVTINQTVQISTGVAQTVRTEIASLMPQIAAATKQAVVDARRRGGSFATAFGG